MIYGTWKDLERYRGLYRSLDVLIDWSRDHDFRTLPVGSHPIDGERVYANVMEATTRDAADASFETHYRYMDVQVDVEGREAFQVAAGQTTPVAAYDEADDFELVDCADALCGDLAHGAFVLFMAGEPHKPTLLYGADGPAPVRKICFKLIVDELF